MGKRLFSAGVLFFAAFLLGTYVKAANAQVSNSSADGQKKAIMTDNGSNDGVFIGRYQFNYIGNCSYYQELGDDSSKWKIDKSKIKNNGSDKAKKAAKKVLGESITNSTKATLKKRSKGNGNIRAAYLVWQTRQPVGTGKQGQSIALVDPNGNAYKVDAKASIVDHRKTKVWDYKSIYCLYADVTKFVTGNAEGGKGKFGTYTVCNLPIWDLQTAAKTGGGGGSFAVWELVVIEEGDDFPMRACTLSMTSTFTLDEKLDAIEVPITTTLGRHIKTRANDGKKVNGQLFFAASGGDANSKYVTNISMKDANGKSTGTLADSNGRSGTEIADSSVCVSMFDFAEKSFYNSSSAAFSIKGKSYVNAAGVTVYPYTSVYMLGMAVDIAQPTFSGGQSTVINPDGTVTVSAADENAVTNTTVKQDETGYYDGRFTITLDEALEPIDTGNLTLSYYNAKTKNLYTIKGSYSNQVITFNFKEKSKFNNCVKGSYLSYSIICKVTDQKAAQFRNAHQLSGYLCSRGADTGSYIQNFQRSTSSAQMEGYTVHYDGNGGDANHIEDMRCKVNTTYTITKEIPYRDGYTFANYWTDHPDGSGNKYINGNPFHNLVNLGQTKTLYAQWYKGTGYIVHFDPNGGTVDKTHRVEDMECDWNTTYYYPECNFKAPTADGEELHFIGWGLQRKTTDVKRKGTSFYNLAGTTTQEITVYAIWSPYYKVLYNNYRQTLENTYFQIYPSRSILENRDLQENLQTQIQNCRYNSEKRNYQYNALTGDSFSQPSDKKQMFKAWYSTNALMSNWQNKNKIKEYERSISELIKNMENIRYQIKSLERENNSDFDVSEAIKKQIERYQKDLNEYQKQLLECQKKWIKQKEENKITPIVGVGEQFDEEILSKEKERSREYIVENNYVIEVLSVNAFYEKEDKICKITYDGNFASYGYDLTAAGSEMVYCMEDGTPVYIIQELSDKAAATKDIYYNKPEVLKFLGWSYSKNADADEIVYRPGDLLQPETFHSKSEQTLYAVWERVGIAIHYYGNEATAGQKKSQIILFEDDTNERGEYTVKVGENTPLNDGYIRENHEFITWSTNPKLKYVNAEWSKEAYAPETEITFRLSKNKIYLEKGQENSKELKGDLDFYAIWKRTSYKVSLYASDGVKENSLDGAGSYKAGQIVRISAKTKQGYHWKNWTGNCEREEKTILTIQEQNYSFVMPEHDVDMSANAEANSYTIRFDSNGGSGQINDIRTVYDADVTLPDAADCYKKYTLDGINLTTDVVSGKIPNDLIVRSGIKEKDNFIEAELENKDDVKAAQSMKRAYKSVFLGWALYENKDKTAPTWKAGDLVRNLISENNGTVTLYAVWDDCPWITATDLYYTLEEAQNGTITEMEILSHAAAVDREDGSPILPGVNPAKNNPAGKTSFSIPDYQTDEFTQMTHDASVTENLTVTDSAGNTYWKQITVYVTDTMPQEVKPSGEVRFISEKYVQADYEHGGLSEQSIWKTNSEYQEILKKAFENLKNDTPEETYYFTHETILEMKKFIREHGFGNRKEADALQRFFVQFIEPNVIK